MVDLIRGTTDRRRNENAVHSRGSDRSVEKRWRTNLCSKPSVPRTPFFNFFSASPKPSTAPVLGSRWRRRAKEQGLTCEAQKRHQGCFQASGGGPTTQGPLSNRTYAGNFAAWKGSCFHPVTQSSKGWSACVRACVCVSESTQHLWQQGKMA